MTSVLSENQWLFSQMVPALVGAFLVGLGVHLLERRRTNMEKRKQLKGILSLIIAEMKLSLEELQSSKQIFHIDSVIENSLPRFTGLKIDGLNLFLQSMGLVGMISSVRLGDLVFIYEELYKLKTCLLSVVLAGKKVDKYYYSLGAKMVTTIHWLEFLVSLEERRFDFLEFMKTLK